MLLEAPQNSSLVASLPEGTCRFLQAPPGNRSRRRTALVSVFKPFCLLTSRTSHQQLPFKQLAVVLCCYVVVTHLPRPISVKEGLEGMLSSPGSSKGRPSCDTGREDATSCACLLHDLAESQIPVPSLPSLPRSGFDLGFMVLATEIRQNEWSCGTVDKLMSHKSARRHRTTNGWQRFGGRVEDKRYA